MATRGKGAAGAAAPVDVQASSEARSLATKLLASMGADVSKVSAVAPSASASGFTRGAPESRPARLGLGAKFLPHNKAAAAKDAVAAEIEKKITSAATKRKRDEDAADGDADTGAKATKKLKSATVKADSEDDDDESESKVTAVAKASKPVADPLALAKPAAADASSNAARNKKKRERRKRAKESKAVATTGAVEGANGSGKASAGDDTDDVSENPVDAADKGWEVVLPVGDTAKAIEVAWERAGAFFRGADARAAPTNKPAVEKKAVGVVKGKGAQEAASARTLTADATAKNAKQNAPKQDAPKGAAPRAQLKGSNEQPNGGPARAEKRTRGDDDGSDGDVGADGDSRAAKVRRVDDGGQGGAGASAKPKRKKVRSKQKNLKKDNRPPEKKPTYRTPGATDFVPKKPFFVHKKKSDTKAKSADGPSDGGDD